MDTMFKFHEFGFKTVAVICDGASSNLSIIKLMMPRHMVMLVPFVYKYGNVICCIAFGSCSDSVDRFSVSPWFTSP